MKRTLRTLLLFSLAFSLGAEAADPPLIVPQGLPGRLPGTLPGQQPLAAPKPASTPPPAPASDIPANACCEITAIDKATSVVTARERASGRIVEFKASNPALLQKMHIGEAMYANFVTKQVSVDGKTVCCAITNVASPPTTAMKTPAQTPPPAQKAAKTLGAPAQALPGQRLPGQPPASTPAPPTAAAPAAAAARPLPSCCSITEINKAMGFVLAREKSGGRTIEIKASAAQMQNLQVGQDVFANLDTRKASFDGRTICCDLTIVPLASAITAAQPIPKLDPVTNAGSEKIEVGDVFYELSTGSSQLLHSGTFPGVNIGQQITILVALRNTGTTTLSNVQWKVYETSGSAPFDSGVQTLPTLAPSGSGYTLGKVFWKLVEGSHRFAAVIDPNNKIPEAPESRLNNSRILDLIVGPQMQSLQLDPKAAGAPGSVVTNMQDSNGCKANVTLRDVSLVIDLYAPNPLPIPFAGCSMKPEFYKGAQLKNGWQVYGVHLKEATNHFPPPPASMWGWLKRPGGDSLYGQTFLSLPSRSTACSAGEFCGTSISTVLTIVIQGRAGSSPF